LATRLQQQTDTECDDWEPERVDTGRITWKDKPKNRRLGLVAYDNISVLCSVSSPKNLWWEAA
jgi:hypothetical protein